MIKKKHILITLAGAAMLIMLSAIYSFAATNTVPATRLGEGAGVISGYAVSNIQYILNATTPSDLDRVDFTLDNPATTVKIKLVAAGSTFYDCALNAGTWECPTLVPQATVIAADELTVIAGE